MSYPYPQSDGGSSSLYPEATPFPQNLQSNPAAPPYPYYQAPAPNSAPVGPPVYTSTGYSKEFFLPVVPFHTPILGFSPPQRVRLVGFCEDKARRFELNLRKGMDHLLHFNVRFDEKKIVRNSSIGGTQWQKEERDGRTFPFKHGSVFTIELIAVGTKITAMINGEHYCDFASRDDPRFVTQVEVAGDIRVHSLSVGI